VAETPQKPHRSGGIVFGLARSDLLHEWILTTCLVMAIAAVLSPLLLLFGLKFGTIETLRHRLIMDPRNREIRPMVSKSFTRQWFDQMRQRHDVAFIVPTTRQISSTVDVQAHGRGPKKALDIIPTMDGDPLIRENGAPIPGEGQCVLSAAAAQELGVKTGDTVLAWAKRIKGRRYQSASTRLRVAGVLNPRASMRKAMYVRLDFLEAVEAYKDGRAVPRFGWSGTTALAYPVYSGLVVVVPQKLTKLEENMLVINTGFSKVVEPGEDLDKKIGFHLGRHMQIYLLTTRKPVGLESVGAVRGRLRGKGATLLPLAGPLAAELLGPGGTKVADLKVVGLSVHPGMAADLKLSPLPPWGRGQGSMAKLLTIMLPQGLKVPPGPLSLKLTRGKQTLSFPVQATEERGPAGDVAYLPSRLAGILNLFQHRNISFDPTGKEFILARRGYAGFRMYAATIDDVPKLKQFLEGPGQALRVHTEASRIRDVVELNTYLTLIFWLIAVVGIVGGLASLIASLYASVERKKKEMAVLRLLGLSGGKLFRFPIYQGIIIAGGGYLVAMAFFQLLAYTINTLFAAHLQKGESFCELPWPYALASLAATIAIAVLAASLAAWRATRIEPAEALRDE